MGPLQPTVMVAAAHPQFQVVFDAADPHRVVAFWAAALGYEVEDHTAVVDGLVEAGQLPPQAVIEFAGDHRGFADVAAASDPDSGRPRLFFQRVPESKTMKNRVHLDLHVGTVAIDDTVERLTGLGAVFAWETLDRGPRNVTMHDPEGNEFCVS